MILNNTQKHHRRNHVAPVTPFMSRFSAILLSHSFVVQDRSISAKLSKLLGSFHEDRDLLTYLLDCTNNAIHSLGYSIERILFQILRTHAFIDSLSIVFQSSYPNSSNNDDLDELSLASMLFWNLRNPDSSQNCLDETLQILERWLDEFEVSISTHCLKSFLLDKSCSIQPIEAFGRTVLRPQVWPFVLARIRKQIKFRSMKDEVAADFLKEVLLLLARSSENCNSFLLDVESSKSIIRLLRQFLLYTLSEELVNITKSIMKHLSLHVILEGKSQLAFFHYLIQLLSSASLQSEVLSIFGSILFSLVSGEGKMRLTMLSEPEDLSSLLQWSRSLRGFVAHEFIVRQPRFPNLRNRRENRISSFTDNSDDVNDRIPEKFLENELKLIQALETILARISQEIVYEELLNVQLLLTFLYVLKSKLQFYEFAESPLDELEAIRDQYISGKGFQGRLNVIGNLSLIKEPNHHPSQSYSLKCDHPIFVLSSLDEFLSKHILKQRLFALERDFSDTVFSTMCLIKSLNKNFNLSVEQSELIGTLLKSKRLIQSTSNSNAVFSRQPGQWKWGLVEIPSQRRKSIKTLGTASKLLRKISQRMRKQVSSQKFMTTESMSRGRSSSTGSLSQS